MVYIFALIFGLVGKAVALVFKLIINLAEKGMLFPAVIASVGGYFAYKLWNEDTLGEKALGIIIAVIMLAVVFALVVKRHEKDNPDKKLKWGMLGLLDQPKPYKTKVNHAQTPQALQSPTPHGVVFGKQGRKKYITKHEDVDGHVLVVGGVGSGKTSCIAIPTLRAWQSSVFAIDIKGDLYEQTKNHRADIKVFNPLDFDDNAYGYDPLYCLRKSSNPAQEAKAIAQAIIPLPPDTKEPFWIENAQNILTACILHFNEQDMHFQDILVEIQYTDPKELIQKLCKSPVREVVYYVNSFAGLEDKVLFSIMAELGKNIIPFITDENLVWAMSKNNNITPDDLEYGNDIYIQIPEHLLRQWKTLLTLIVNQFLTHFERREENNPRPILFLLDEFPRLGKVNAILDGLATLRSKKITICPIVQSLAQLDMVYGKNERKVIADTCSYKAILGASCADTQDYFSRLVGTYDKIVTNHGTGSDFLGLPNSKSTNTSEAEKRIIKPEEFGRLSDIVLLTPYGMTRVEKSPYYLEK